MTSMQFEMYIRGYENRKYKLSPAHSDMCIYGLQLQGKYLPRTSQRIVHINMKGQGVPLYGAGASLPVMSDKPDMVPVKLDMEIISNGNVVGKLVKTKHLQHITCYLVITNSRNIEVNMFKEKSCTHN